MLPAINHWQSAVAKASGPAGGGVRISPAQPARARRRAVPTRLDGVKPRHGVKLRHGSTETCPARLDGRASSRVTASRRHGDGVTASRRHGVKPRHGSTRHRLDGRQGAEGALTSWPDWPGEKRVRIFSLSCPDGVKGRQSALLTTAVYIL